MREQLRLVGQKYRKKETGPRPWKSIEIRGNKYAAELSDAKVREIKSLRFTGKLQRQVAKEFGIGRQMVGLIWSGKRWKEIE
jgi:DNA invertase Pin-like site-specific DNA recombinase